MSNITDQSPLAPMISGCETLAPADPPYGAFALKGINARMATRAQAQSDSWLGRRFSIGLRKLVLALKPSAIDGRLWGFRVRMHPLDNVTDRHAFFLPNSWDVVERDFQDRHLPEDGVYIDVGANSGLYSLLASRRLGPGGLLLALEPNPVMFARLRVNLGLNPPRARFKLYPCGIAERVGEFELMHGARNLGSGSITGRSGASRGVKVVCRPLLDVVLEAGLERIDFLKVDIEGYEAPALKPFFEAASRSLWPRFINIESPGGIDWTALGYEVAARTRQNTLLMLSSRPDQASPAVQPV